jgi:CP family cyanate transporter-like MFS transporter
MTSTGSRSPAAALRGRTAALALLIAWWVGFNLRSVLLSVPPVLGHVRDDLGLSYTATGLLASLPVLILGALAFPGAALVRRHGGHRVVAAGLLLTAAGAALRALPGGAVPVFGGTLLLAAGIAVAQPGLPVMLQAWFPGEVQRASTTVTLGLIVGEVTGAGVTGPLLLPTVGWRGSFVVWSLPVLVALLGWLLVPGRGLAGVADQRRPLRPLLRSRLLWWTAILFAGQSLVYFAANTWVPSSVHGGSDSVAASVDLTLLNLVMLPVTLVLAVTRRPFVRSRAFYVVGGLAALAGAVGWMLSADSLGPLWVLLIGTGTSSTFAGLLAYPPTVAAPEDVAAYAAMMLTVGYVAAFVGPVLGGTARDLLHTQWAPFLPIAVAAAVWVVAALRVPHPRTAP